MRLLITGASGQLGAELMGVAPSGGADAVGLDRASLDITDRAAVAAALDLHRPDTVVNCAAWTNVDGAESHRAEAFAINEEGARLLAQECARRSLLLVQLSTDYVFDGESNQPYAETATPAPLSAYGASKLAGEEAVRAITDHHLIVRTSGLYGSDGPNFILKVLHRAATGADLRVVVDQVTAPTWTGHLAPALVRLVERGASGTFHLTNSGTTSWHGFATSAIARAGYDVEVRPIQSTELAAEARRPSHAVLDNRAWLQLGEAPLPHWESALVAYIDRLRRSGQLTAPAAAPPHGPT